MAPAQIELVLPARPENVAILRTMAGDLAASRNLPYDRWEDLELAVDELSTLLLRSLPAAMRCVLRATDVGIAVEMASVEPSRSADGDELAELVLSGIATDVELVLDADPPRGAVVVPAAP